MHTIIDKLAWIYVRHGTILSTRSIGRAKYYIPGGKREENETDIQPLKREVGEELGVSLVDDSLQFYGKFEAQADGHEPGVTVRMTCYTAEFRGTIRPMNELRKWFG